MFNQRQWAELNAFTASFGANNGGQQNNSQPQAHQQHQHQHQEQQFRQSSAGNEHMVNHHQQPQPQPQSQPQPQVQPQYIQQPQPPQPQYQQPEQLPFQCDFSPQQEWPKFGFDAGTPSGNITAFQDHVRQNYFGSQSNEMDWTPSSDFSSGFDQGLETSHHGQQQQQSAVKMEHEGINPAMNSYDHNHNGNQTSDTGRGVGNLISQFEQKDFQPPLPPRPNNNSIDNSVTSPIAIAHQQQPPPSHFHQFNAAPQGHSFAASSNPFTNSFASHRVGTPSDTNFGSFGTSVSRVTSPIATSPPPAPFGSFHHDGSVVGSPSTAPTSDPFGSLDNFVNRPMGHHMQHGMPQSPAPTTPGHGTGTPGFAMWKAPAHEQPGTPQGFEHFQQQYPPQHHQPPLQQAHSLQRPMSRQHSIATSPGGYMVPPVPPKVKPTIGHANQFILELNPGKAKGKAPVKPPKPKPKPSLSLPLPTSVSMIKEEPQTPALPPTPFMPEVAIKRAETPSESSTPRPPIVARPSRDQVPAESWESWKPTIHDLYLEQRKPLKEVMSIMAEQYNFQATPKMYKTRFSQWGFVKNNTEDEVKKLLSMKFQRDSQGKVSEFVRNGKIVNLSTYLKRKGVTEYDLVDFEVPNNLPSHIRCRTPTPPPAPEYLKSPDLVRAQETIVSNIRKAFLQCRQWELETERHVGWPSTMVWGAPSSEMLTEANFYFEAGDADSGGQCLMNAFNQLEIDLKQLSPQAILEMLFGMVRRDPGLMTALCKYVGAFSTTNYDRAHPLRQIFTCLYDVQQKHGAATLSDLLWGSSPLIAEELESIYGRRHPYVARTWIDMATFYDQKTPDRLQKLAQELTLQHRQLSQSQGTDFSDLLALRYAMAQLLYAADPENDAAKQAAKDLLDDMKGAKLLHRVRGSKNTYCYHCAVKNDPWTKRCRRRYDSIVELLEKHTGTKILPYFEEDFHTQEHEPESQPQAQPQQAQNAWAAAMGMGSNRWGFL